MTNDTPRRLASSSQFSHPRTKQRRFSRCRDIRTVDKRCTSRPVGFLLQEVVAVKKQKRRPASKGRKTETTHHTHHHRRISLSPPSQTGAFGGKHQPNNPSSVKNLERLCTISLYMMTRFSRRGVIPHLAVLGVLNSVVLTYTWLSSFDFVMAFLHPMKIPTNVGRLQFPSLFATSKESGNRPINKSPTKRNNVKQNVIGIRKKRPSDRGIQSPPLSSLVQPASTITLETQLAYTRNGHAVLRNIIDPVRLKKMREELRQIMIKEEISSWRQKVQVASGSETLASSCQSVRQCQAELRKLGITESLPFLQFFNTFRRLETVRELAFALGEAASILLDVPIVRLYQDSVFWKRIGDGPTPWHVDARMAPFDTSHFITFWIPLQDIPNDGTALLFCSKSHNDFSLPYWNSIEKSQDVNSEWNRLEHRYPKEPVHYMPMKMGDLTIHSGWTLHCTDGTHEGSVDRMALAISFVDANAQIRPDCMDDEGMGDNEDRWSYQEWVPSVPTRKPFKHPLVPIVWPPMTKDL